MDGLEDLLAAMKIHDKLSFESLNGAWDNASDEHSNKFFWKSILYIFEFLTCIGDMDESVLPTQSHRYAKRHHGGKFRFASKYIRLQLVLTMAVFMQKATAGKYTRHRSYSPLVPV